jgi:hypothetical protein
MSTKTTFKRIALVAVAALGFGMLSVVPSTAASTGTVIVTDSANASGAVGTAVTFIDLPKSPKTLRKVLKPYGVDIHSLRHTYAYLLKQQGVHVTTAQRFLGHSDPRVTMSIYTQVLDNEIDEVGLLLSKAAGF